MMEDQVKKTVDAVKTKAVATKEELQQSGAAEPAVSAPAKKVMVDDTHKYTTVTADAYIGPGNAHHRYTINDKKAQVLGFLTFQDGPIKEAGINGVMDENLLAILIDRLTGFQSGKYACQENATALSKCKSALVMLKARTIRREKEGKEGTHKI